ncbi:MAG: hypothetical protein ACYTFG_12820, partial [Planctomycetota bacterium]
MTMELLYYLVPAFLNLSIGVWILSKRPHMATNRWFFATTVFFLAWGVGDALRSVAAGPLTALTIDKITSTMGLLLPLFSLWFLHSFHSEAKGRAGGPNKIATAALGLGGAAFASLLWGTDWIYSGAEKLGATYSIVPGPAYVFFG